MIFAIVQVVAEKGYAAATVADVVERANVSRKTFYDQFPDKAACFLVAWDTGVEIVLGRLREAAAALPGSDWRAHLRSDIATYLDVLAGEPAFAWSLHVEALGAGAAALERRAAIFALFSRRTQRLHELARRQNPALPQLGDEAFQLHTGGMDELVRECLRTRGAAALPQLAEGATRATLALFGDQGSEGTPTVDA